MIKILVIGHRGAGGYSPHNSRQGFSQAIKLGAHMIETDIRITKDNVPVLYHDSITKWGPVNEINWKELENFPLSNGEFLPSLEEILDLFSSQISFNLEIKPVSLEKIEPVLYILKKYKSSNILISSFSLPILTEINRLTSYETAFLIEKNLNFHHLLENLKTTRISTLNLHYSLLNQKLIKLIKSYQYKLIIWTDFKSEIWNPESIYSKAFNFGIDGFITGKPDLLVKFLKIKGISSLRG